MKQSLIDNIGEDWAKILKPFFNSDEYKKIGEALKGTMTPDEVKDIFKAFRNCPFSGTHTVFLASRPPKDVTNKVAKCYMDAIRDAIFDGKDVQGNFEKLSGEGILFLDNDFTTGDQPQKYYIELWKPFITYLIKRLNADPYVTMTFVLVGAASHKYFDLINGEVNDCYKLEHPVKAITENRPWEHNMIFERIYTIANFVHNKKINYAS